MVASSGAAPRFAHNQGFVPGKTPSLPQRSAPASHYKQGALAQVPRSRPPQVSVNALDRAGNIRTQSSEAELKEHIIGRLEDIPLAALEKIKQFCDEGSETSQALARRNNAADPLSSRFLQANTQVIKSTGKGKGKGPVPKRKAEVTFEDSEDENEVEEWCDVPLKDSKIYISLGKEDEVVHFLQMRFTQIQQLATKVIAKAWIKAICPKKQASYPYVDSNPRNDSRSRKPKHEGAPRIPNFWPDISLCRHKEPDHTKKSERTHLLVHLLRLRWSAKEWIASNGQNCEVPNLVKAGCWVQFLKDAFPVSKLDEMQGSNSAKSAQRKEYLTHIYDVAAQEENVRRSNRSGTSAGGVQYSRGPGWIPLGAEILHTVTQQTKRRNGKEKSGTPSSAANATIRSDSLSEIYTDTPESDEQDEVLRPASPISDFEFAKEAKLDHLLPLEVEEVVVNPPGWRSIENPVHKAEYGSHSVPISTDETPQTPVDGAGYYDSAWGDGMRNSNTDRPLYDGFSGTAPQWYGNANYGFGPSQQSPLSGFPSSTDGAVMNGYRQNFAAFEPAVESPPLQGRFASQMTLTQNQFRSGYAEMQQMVPSASFPQAAVVTTAGDLQDLGYGVSGLRYADTFGQSNTSERFMAEPNQEIHGRWP